MKMAPGAELDPGKVREEFPLLSQKRGKGRFVYLDSAATTQKPERVIAAQARFYRESNANVHRGLYDLAGRATQVYEGCRGRVAAFLGADPRGVVITRNATAALNLAALGSARLLGRGDEILATVMEHHANLVPWIQVAKRTGAALKHIPLDRMGRLDLEGLRGLLGPRTRIVALSAASNVLGTIPPLAEITRRAREAGALVVVDAAQAAGRLPLSFEETGADLLAFSAHKCYGPMGLGFLVGKPRVLERLEPLETGGEMIEAVHLDRATWAKVPHRFEAGTPNVAAAAAFPPALDLLEEIGLDRVRRHEVELTEYALERLSSLEGLEVLGPAGPEERVGLVSFHDPLVHPHDLATFLDGEGVAVRAGHHCAQPLHRILGIPSSVRASFGIYTLKEDVDALVEGIGKARRYFQG